MTRLDHNRGLAQLTEKTGARLADVKKVIIWGNHSATQYPDLTTPPSAASRRCRWWMESWFKEHFIPTVQQRGAAIIKARGTSSAASAASRRSTTSTTGCSARRRRLGQHGVPSDGSYGIPGGRDLFLSGDLQERRIQHRAGIGYQRLQPRENEATHRELLEERDGVKDLI
jgi:malate dehydrogenase